MNYLQKYLNFKIWIDDFADDLHPYIVEIIKKTKNNKNLFLKHLYSQKTNNYRIKYDFYGLALNYFDYQATKDWIMEMKKNSFQIPNLFDAINQENKLVFYQKAKLINNEEIEQLFLDLVNELPKAVTPLGIVHSITWSQNIFSSSPDSVINLTKVIKLALHFQKQNFFRKKLEKKFYQFLQKDGWDNYSLEQIISIYIKTMKIFSNLDNDFSPEDLKKKIEKIIKNFNNNQNTVNLIKWYWKKITGSFFYEEKPYKFSLAEYYDCLNQRYSFSDFDFIFQNEIVPKIKKIIKNNPSLVNKKEPEITLKISAKLTLWLKDNHNIYYQRESDPYTNSKQREKRIDAILYHLDIMALIEFKKISNKDLTTDKILEQLKSYESIHKKATHHYLVIFLNPKQEKELELEIRKKIENKINGSDYKVIYI